MLAIILTLVTQAQSAPGSTWNVHAQGPRLYSFGPLDSHLLLSYDTRTQKETQIKLPSDLAAISGGDKFLCIQTKDGKIGRLDSGSIKWIIRGSSVPQWERAHFDVNETTRQIAYVQKRSLLTVADEYGKTLRTHKLPSDPYDLSISIITASDVAIATGVYSANTWLYWYRADKPVTKVKLPSKPSSLFSRLPGGGLCAAWFDSSSSKTQVCEYHLGNVGGITLVRTTTLPSQYITSSTIRKGRLLFTSSDSNWESWLYTYGGTTRRKIEAAGEARSLAVVGNKIYVGMASGKFLQMAL